MLQEQQDPSLGGAAQGAMPESSGAAGVIEPEKPSQKHPSVGMEVGSHGVCCDCVCLPRDFAFPSASKLCMQCQPLDRRLLGTLGAEACMSMAALRSSQHLCAQVPAQMSNEEAVKHVAPQVPAAEGGDTRLPDPAMPGAEKLSPNDPSPRCGLRADGPLCAACF